MRTLLTDLAISPTLPITNPQEMINQIGIKASLSIYDKLGMSQSIADILNMKIILDTKMNTQIINHKLDKRGITAAYASKYNVLFTNKITKKRDMSQIAIRNGLHITTLICDNDVDDNDMLQCKSIENLIIRDHTSITTFKPFEKTIRVLSAGKCLPAVAYVYCFRPASGIDDKCIKNCTNIESLYTDDNHLITTCVPFAKSLRKLSASGESGISNNGLLFCDRIEELNASYNEKISTCAPFANSLRKLSASNTSNISDNGLQHCKYIEYLNADNNNKITTCKPFAKSLKHLRAAEHCGINNNGLQSCTNIIMLDAFCNKKITTCNPFAKSLRVLSATGTSCGINDKGLVCCTFIEKLDATDNDNITTCQHFGKTLRTLVAANLCGISDAGLQFCTAIEDLNANSNTKITSCVSSAKSLRVAHVKYNQHLYETLCNDNRKVYKSIEKIIIDKYRDPDTSDDDCDAPNHVVTNPLNDDVTLRKLITKLYTSENAHGKAPRKKQDVVMCVCKK